MGKRTRHKTNRWNRIPFALIFVLLIGCSQVNDLPLNPEAAFNFPEVPRNARTFMQTFVVGATMSDAMRRDFTDPPETRAGILCILWAGRRRCGLTRRVGGEP